MSKCKRNILLIFGYLLIVAIFFLPCQKIIYNYSGKKITARNTVAFIPFLISGGVKYKKYKNWLSSWPSKDRKLDIDVGTKALTELLKEKDAELKLLKKKEISPERFAKEIWLEDSIKSIKSKLINLEKNIKEDEFISQFGERPYYYKLRFEIFISEIAIILLIASFAYILFCVALRKGEKKGEK